MCICTEVNYDYFTEMLSISSVTGNIKHVSLTDVSITSVKK